MIIELMGFLVLASALTYGAAWAADQALRRLGRPARWVWLLGISAPFALLVLRRVLPDAGAAVTPDAVLALPPMVVGDAGSSIFGAWLPAALGLAWLTTSLGLAGMLVREQSSLLRAREVWSSSIVSGRDVYVSPDRGPAVVGIVRPWIVLPRWALSLPSSELDFVLLHEEEHVRARDTLLLASSLFFVVLAPWNPVSWLHLRGLKTAMEVDCDRRVLRRAPDRRGYGGSLISVAARSSGLSLGLAAFTERRRFLETRILAMTHERTRWTPIASLLLALVAVLVGVQACYVESPILIINGDEEDVAAIEELVGPAAVDAANAEIPEAPPAVEAELPPTRLGQPEAEDPLSGGAGAEEAAKRPAGPRPADPEELAAEPTFTPFTKAPVIVNRDEVVAAMSDAYPPLLRDAGIGGTIHVYFFIDAEGRVRDHRINSSSGHPALDQAALAVAEVYRFRPALNREEPVPVWVSFPITFQAGESDLR